MRVKKSKTKILAISTSFLLLILIIIFLSRPEDKSKFDEETNKISYSEHRSPPKYSITKLNTTENYTTFRIVYDSASFLGKNGKIHGLLYLPQTKESTPGIVFLPGGSIKKEDEPTGPVLANLGYSVLVIDQRGIGETGGFYPSYEQDRLIFSNKDESIQHLGVYDALRAIDILRDIDSINKERLAIGGSSMGGRYAIIAAATDKKIRCALIISSAGFHIDETPLNKDKYFLSIDPDRYIDNISPSKLIMIHSKTDKIIKLEDSIKTFNKASEPKAFYYVENCTHGYCPSMLPFIDKELNECLKK